MQEMPRNGGPLQSISAVIFDYGEVLCYPPPQALYDKMSEIAGLQEQQFFTVYWQLRPQYDAGELNGQAYWKKFAVESQRRFSDEQIKRLIEVDVRCWTEPDPEMLRWVAKLQRAGIKTAILSNMVVEVLAAMRKKFAWLENFTHLTFSCNLGCVKPDAKIYRECLTGLGVRADEALFIDDREKNVAAARDLGMHALQFSGITNLRDELSAKYVLPLPEIGEYICSQR
jgi:putative hydrolase of the HAD superfamily